MTYLGRIGVNSFNGMMFSSEPFTDKNESEPAKTISLSRSKIQCKGRLDVGECCGNKGNRYLSHSHTAVGMATDHVLLCICIPATSSSPVMSLNAFWTFDGVFLSTSLAVRIVLQICPMLGHT